VSSVRFFGIGSIDVPRPRPPASFPGDGHEYLRRLTDIQVLDAFWYQILGPGHMERLGSLPGARDIGHGKVELVLGEPSDWVDPAKAEEIRSYGRSLLAPCFLSLEEARAILKQRRTGLS
jgi:hypothetical protein